MKAKELFIIREGKLRGNWGLLKKKKEALKTIIVFILKGVGSCVFLFCFVLFF